MGPLHLRGDPPDGIDLHGDGLDPVAIDLLEQVADGRLRGDAVNPEPVDDRAWISMIPWLACVHA